MGPRRWNQVHGKRHLFQVLLRWPANVWRRWFYGTKGWPLRVAWPSIFLLFHRSPVLPSALRYRLWVLALENFLILVSFIVLSSIVSNFNCYSILCSIYQMFAATAILTTRICYTPQKFAHSVTKIYLIRHLSMRTSPVIMMHRPRPSRRRWVSSTHQ